MRKRKEKKIVKDNLFNYEIREDDSLIITGFLGNPDIEKLTIPDKLYDTFVTDISENAFDNCRRVESLTLPAKLNYFNQSIISNFKRLKCIIINNPDIEIESDTFIANTELKYVILHKKLYNKLMNDDYPGISGKVGFDKYGINPWITQFIPFGSERLKFCTATNMSNMYNDAISEYNVRLPYRKRRKTSSRKKMGLVFDPFGNADSTLFAYTYVKDHLRENLSEDDATIIAFLTDFMQTLAYDEYNSFETFDKKINESLYITFINAVENNRLSVIKEWMDIEFQRYDYVHRKRHEYVVLFYNFVIRKLIEYFFEIEKPSFDDLSAVTSYAFSKSNITESDISNLIGYINKKNTGEEIQPDDPLSKVYSGNAQNNINEIASLTILWGFYNQFIDAPIVIDFYFPIDELKEKKDGMRAVETISTALEAKIDISNVMKSLNFIAENSGSVDLETLTLIESHIQSANHPTKVTVSDSVKENLKSENKTDVDVPVENVNANAKPVDSTLETDNASEELETSTKTDTIDEMTNTKDQSSDDKNETHKKEKQKKKFVNRSSNPNKTSEQDNADPLNMSLVQKL